MKTLKTAVAITLVFSITFFFANKIKTSAKEIKASLTNSTHEGYRSFVLDYIK